MIEELKCNNLKFQNKQIRLKSYGLKGKYKNKSKDISLDITW